MARRAADQSGDDRPVADIQGGDQISTPGRRSTVLAVLLTSLVWLVVGGSSLLFWRRPQPVTFAVQPPPATSTPAPTATPSPIQVDVIGAVRRPGVYQLPAGARVADALVAAGGLASNAAIDALNQASLLQDGSQLAVPTARPAGAVPASTFAPDSAAARSEGIAPGPASRTNLNSASVTELEALPAIGPVTAKAIVDYRTANGPFRSVEDIVKVKGIGAATLEKLRPLITVGE